jgi:hypothetical protein
MTEYDYVSLRLRAADQLAAVTTVRTELVQWFAGHRPPIGRVAGLFVPQLGWSYRQVALLIERGDDAAADDALLENLAAQPQIETCNIQRVLPTIRPLRGDSLTPGGMYVHRWMDVRATDADEFIALAAEAWSDPEQTSFDWRAFGLFKEKMNGPVQRMLLLTHYGSHAEWEASRVATPSRSLRDWEAAGRPAAATRQALTRRQTLTLDSVPASTLLAVS